MYVMIASDMCSTYYANLKSIISNMSCANLGHAVSRIILIGSLGSAKFYSFTFPANYFVNIEKTMHMGYCKLHISFSKVGIQHLNKNGSDVHFCSNYQ